MSIQRLPEDHNLLRDTINSLLLLVITKLQIVDWIRQIKYLGGDIDRIYIYLLESALEPVKEEYL